MWPGSTPCDAGLKHGTIPCSNLLSFPVNKLQPVNILMRITPMSWWFTPDKTVWTGSHFIHMTSLWEGVATPIAQMKEAKCGEAN